MAKLRIIVDMDSILVDFMEGLWNAYEKATGERGSTKNVRVWDFGTAVTDPKTLYSCMFERGFFRNLNALPGAMDAIQKLQSEGHEIIICSTPCTPHSAAEKIEWVRKHMPFLDQNKVLLGHCKNVVRGDVLIDDAIHNAMAYRKEHPNAFIATIAYPYNARHKKCYDLRAPDYKKPGKAWGTIVKGIQMYAKHLDAQKKRGLADH